MQDRKPQHKPWITKRLQSLSKAKNLVRGKYKRCQDKIFKKNLYLQDKNHYGLVLTLNKDSKNTCKLIFLLFQGKCLKI